MLRHQFSHTSVMFGKWFLILIWSVGEGESCQAVKNGIGVG